MDERLLSLIWRAQRFDRDGLRTTTGEPVEIVYRGRAHRAPGPDFRDAAFLIAGELHYGDVEVHVRSSAWPQHHHSRDRLYDGVVLHVVRTDDALAPIRTRAGRIVPCLEMDGRLGDGESQAALALSVLPDCTTRLQRLTDERLGERLDALGDERLRDRAAEFETELALVGPEQLLYERLLEALGYGENRRAFCDLARRLPIASLYALAHRLPLADRELLGEALLFGVAGLLPSQRDVGTELDWASASHADELESVWAVYGAEWSDETLNAHDWTFGVRPLNTPPRRLAAAARLVAAALPTGLGASLVENLGGDPERDPRDTVRALVRVSTVDAPGSFWAEHFDFGRTLAAPAPRLVGAERALIVATNVHLPYALALGDRALGRRALAAYAAAPRLAANEVTRWMVAEVIGPARSRIVTTARRAQGLHRLHQVGCDVAGCDPCPLFATAYQGLPERMPPST